MKVTVLGTGIYGLALASMLAKNGANVCMWTENEDKYKEWEKHKNIKSIIDYKLPDNIRLTKSYEDALKDANLIILVCASKYLNKVLVNIKPYYDKNVPICVATKGINDEDGSFFSDNIKDVLNTKKVAVLSGPTFAVDILSCEPVALALATKSKKVFKLIKSLLSSDTLKLRRSRDLIGVQICGSVKNIIAIASGILNGLGHSESTSAFLINESLHDIKNLIHALKGKKRTILSYAGVGDLLMTSMSSKSRNFSFGKIVATGNKKKIDEYLNTITVEGYTTLKTILKLLDKKNIDVPLFKLINDIIDGNKKPEILLEFLVTKE